MDSHASGRSESRILTLNLIDFLAEPVRIQDQNPDTALRAGGGAAQGQEANPI